MTVRTGCLNPCDLGPVMVMHPDGTWYGGVDETAVDCIVAERLEDGEVVEEYASASLKSLPQQPGTKRD